MGRFRRLERLGSGGMGTVYRALDERLQREVALKEIEGADARRVLREAKAAARLNHPAIVTLYEFGSDGRRALLISELAQGSPLGELASAGRLSDRDVGDVGLDICAALAHAHERGVIHRDVKPANVVVDIEPGGPRAKLMDFGIAAIAGESPLTATGEVVGTLAYMSPEQAEGEPAGEASDVYALALSLYECWSGVNPVAGPTPAATARRIGSSLASLADDRPDLPEPLVAVIDDCLRPDADDRPLLDELTEVLEDEVPALDAERPVPSHAIEPRERDVDVARAARVAAALALGAGAFLLAAAAGLPGLALVLALLIGPSLFLAASLERVLIPPLAPVLAATIFGAAYPALAGRKGSAIERVGLAVLGWCWLAAASLTISGVPHLGLGAHAGSGWETSAHQAASQVLAPMFGWQSLACAAAFGIAAWAMGPILRAGHVALAFVWAVLWTAGLEGALRAAGEPAVAASPLAGAAAVFALIALAFRERDNEHARSPSSLGAPSASSGSPARS